MKKVYVIGVILLCMMLLLGTLISCGPSEKEQEALRKQQQEQEEKEKQEQEIRRVQSLIDDIPLESYNATITGIYTLIVKAEEAEEAYNNLSENLKNQISNYDRIEKAKAIFEFDKWEDRAVGKLELAIKASLINASSYEPYSSVCNIYYDTALNNPVCCYVSVHFSATNRLGGRIDSYESAEYKMDNDGNWQIIYNPDEYDELTKSGIKISNGLELYDARKELRDGVDE